MSQEANAPAGANPKFGRYEILGEVGRGGMGVVYRALDPAIGRTVALKTVRLSEQGSQDDAQALRQRLLRESQAAGQLSHPNIVPIFDFGEQADIAYIVMEYISGPTLEQALEQDPSVRSTPVALRILLDCARALDYAHGKGIVHRDVKPGNIMLQPDGTVKIADFGIAKVLQAATLTVTSMMVGSPYYMAPEQLKGEAVSGRTDQYALATLAYAIFTGRRPFEADSIITLITRTLYEEPPPVPSLNPAFGLPVDGVLRRALAKDPAARYASCTEFIEALRTACSAPGSDGAPPTGGETLPIPSPGSVVREFLTSAPGRVGGPATGGGTPYPPPPAISMPPRPERPHTNWVPWGIGALVLLALVAFAAAGVYFYQAKQAKQTKQTQQAALKTTPRDPRTAVLPAISPQIQPPTAKAPPPPASKSTAPTLAKTDHSAPDARPTPTDQPPAAPPPDEACKPGLMQMASERFQACLDTMSSRRFSPATILSYEDNGAVVVMAAFQIPATRRATFAVPADQRNDVKHRMENDGYRPDAVSVLTFNGHRHLFSEIWLPRTGPFEARVFDTKEDFDKARQKFETDGYAITDLVPFQYRNEIRYSAIWIKQAGTETIAQLDLRPLDLSARTQTLTQQGYRISRISGYRTDSGRRFAAVWQKPPGGAFWEVNLTRENLFRTHAEMLGKGYHLHHISFINGGFSAVWWN